MTTTVSPAVSTWLNIGITLLGFLAGAGALLTPVFGEGAAKEVVAIAGLAMGLLAAVNAGLHAVSAPVAGPLVK